MKKTYLKPAMEVVSVQMTQMLCMSVQTNVDLDFGGETPGGFEPRAPEFNPLDDLDI